MEYWSWCLHFFFYCCFAIMSYHAEQSPSQSRSSFRTSHDPFLFDNFMKFLMKNCTVLTDSSWIYNFSHWVCCYVQQKVMYFYSCHSSNGDATPKCDSIGWKGCNYYLSSCWCTYSQYHMDLSGYVSLHNDLLGISVN